MTTWAHRHPWFNPPAMKRRLSASDDGDDGSPSSFDLPPSTFSTGCRKRVRYNSLERTLAHMTLGSALAIASEDADISPKTSPPPPRVQDKLNVILPSLIEEPGTPASESESVDMEVEPALVTTDTSAATPSSHAMNDWQSIELGRLDIKEVEISPAVLECLRRQTKRPRPFIPLRSQSSQALVLYRAPGPPCEDLEEKPTGTPTLVAHEDDVMEVE